MKHPASLLEDDHESLGKLLGELDAELSGMDLQRAFELLDLFWARLAMHIRAENLHLFPALSNAPPARFRGSGGLPTLAEAEGILASLRADHDFFMKELAQLIKVMRTLTANESARTHDIESLRRRLTVIKERLDNHNRVEEEQVYLWPSLLFDSRTLEELDQHLRHELENFPPRFE